MTRDQSLAWIEALDAYLIAQRNLNRSSEVEPIQVAAQAVAAREALIEAMVPIVTGVAR